MNDLQTFQLIRAVISKESILSIRDVQKIVGIISETVGLNPDDVMRQLADRYREEISCLDEEMQLHFSGIVADEW